MKRKTVQQSWLTKPKVDFSNTNNTDKHLAKLIKE